MLSEPEPPPAAPVPAAVVTPVQRWGSRLTWGARICLAVFAALVVLAMISASRNWLWLMAWCAWGLLASGVLGFCLGMGRLVLTLLYEIQIRLHEILFVVAVVGVAQAIALPWAHEEMNASSVSASDVQQEWAALLTAFGVLLYIGVGAVWGWSAAYRLGVESGWKRLGLLVAGWAGVPGMLALVSMALMLLAGWLFDSYLEIELSARLWALLATPMLWVEMYAWRRKRAGG
ncbi:MAG: hypothetical protein HS116_26175 [Planctomycetes bacterium]|nr:hypothetical protein [Planctomycetota bacterium]